MPPDVLVTGLNVVDVLVRLPETVRPGEKHEVPDLAIQGGAPAGNAACVMASLGWRVGFVARIGSDTLSQIALAEFTRHGVLDDYFIHDRQARPAVAVVEIDPATGGRTVFYSLRGYRSLSRSDIPAGAFKDLRLVLVDGYEVEAARAMLQHAGDHGCRSVLDLEAGEPEVLRELLSLGTDSILPRAAAEALAGTAGAIDATLNKLAGWTGGTVVITDGVNGSWSLDGERLLHQRAFQVDVLDTTGCGDAYHGAYASALLKGLPLPLRMEFAAYVAAQVALGFGGRGNLPTPDSIRRADLSMLSPALRDHLLGTP
jgi:sulfofructose kinase